MLVSEGRKLTLRLSHQRFCLPFVAHFGIIQANMKMNSKQYYQYIITVDKEFWPRKLADELTFSQGLKEHLIAVTDLQNDKHIYGKTYLPSRWMEQDQI